MSGSSLVTLTGPGGVGKTRLATKAGSEMVRAFPQGVWFVELAELSETGPVAQTIADALGIREQGGDADLETLIAYLAERHVLLILDNCEQVIESVALVADSLRRSCPRLSILATSRASLGVEGEAVLRVPPLSIPDSEQQPTTLKGAFGYDAVTLFNDRATSAMPDFTISDDNRQAVLRVVTQLDGIPLALELAAARIRSMSAGELADRLEDRYELLTAGRRLGPVRHQTLRLCVDWSYAQCSASEQILWARLSVFVGTFALDSVEGICGFGEIDRHEVIDLVDALVDKSVLTRITVGESTRFRLLESLREYGMERLQQADEYDELRARHMHWYADLTVRSREEWNTGRQIAWAKRLGHELPNLRAAFELALLEPADSVVALTMDSLHLFWASGGMIAEGRRWVVRALDAHDGAPCLERVKALLSAVTLAGLQGDHTGTADMVEESRRISAVLGDDLATAITAHTIGAHGVFGTGSPQAALDALTRAVDGYRELGENLRHGSSLIQLALAAMFLGQLELAKASLDEVVGRREQSGEMMGQAYAYWIGGLVAWKEGDFDRAAALEREALRLRALMFDTVGSSWCLEALAFIAVSAGHPERAAPLFGSAAALAHDVATQSVTFPALVPAYQACERKARAALGDDAFEGLYARGAVLNFDEAIDLALGERRPAAARATSDSPLTKRETQVADLVARGLTNKAIAARLVISQRTAQGHVENILTKLGYTSRAQIAAWVTNRPTGG